MPLQNETPKKRRILPWALLSLGVVALAAVVFLLTIPLELTRFKDRIEPAIEARVNGEVKLGRIIVRALPSPEITLTDIEARYMGAELFSARRLYARVKLLPLLSGRTHFEAIEAQRPSALLVRGHDGALNAARFFKKEAPGEEKAGEPREEAGDGEPRLSIESLQVEGGRLSFIDRFPMQTASFFLRDVNASSTFTKEGTAFTSTATLTPSTKLSVYGLVEGRVIEGRGIVEGLDLLDFNPYIKKPGARVEGHVDLDLSYRIDKTRFASARLDYRSLVASYPSTWDAPLVSPSGSALVTIETAKGLFELAADDIFIDMGTFKAKGSLKLSGPKGSRSMDLSASSTPVGAGKFLRLLPVRKMSPPVAEKVRAIRPLGGTVAINELRLAGNVKELRGAGLLRNPQVSATLTVAGASLAYKDLEAPFTNVGGTVSYGDRTLSFTGLKGRYSRQILDSLTGHVKDLSGDGDFAVRAEGSVDVKDTLTLARSRVKGSLKDTLEKLDADGVASISANVSGSLRHGEPFKYSGETVLRNGSAYYKDVPVGFDSLDASVAFNNERITVKEARVMTDSSSMELTGSVDGYRSPADARFSFHSTGSLAAETLSKATGKGPEEINITAPVQFALSGEGRRKDFRVKADVDATGAGVFVDKYLDKAPGTPLKAQAEGVLRGSEARVDKAMLSFGSSVVEGSGTKTLGSLAYTASVATGQLLISDLDDISPYLKREYPSSGALSFNVKATRASGAERTLFDGHLRLTDGSFDTGLLANPLQNVNASAEFSENRASVSVERLETGSTVLEGRIDLLDISGRAVRFDINFPRLHAQDLLPKKREEKPEEEKQAEEEETAPAEPKEKKFFFGNGTITAAEGDLWKHKFNSLSIAVLMRGPVVEISPASIEVDGGKVTATATMFLAESDPRQFIADLNANGLQFDQVTGASSPRKFLNGTARGRLQLTGMKGEGPLVKRLGGSASIVIDGGRLWKFGFITDIFSFVNILSIDELFKTGLPYKDITGNFTIDRGNISTSDLVFDSDSLRMSAVGRFQLAENNLDLTLALHPFVTIDRIIKNIPIIGWIITGKEESTVSFYFDIEGPAGKPDITPLPVKTIEKGVLGILQRLLNPSKWFD